MPAAKKTAEETNEPKSVFATLNAIDVNEHTEKKNGLTYLSWAWAWGELLKKYPDSMYTIYENKDGLFYHTDGRTAWVKTGVTVEGKEYIEMLPVMDYRNNSIPVDKITSFDVNKAIQRSLTKAVARHGLGLYIYAGEDLPEAVEEPPKPASKKPAAKVEQNAEAEAPAHTEDSAAIIGEIDERLKIVSQNMDKEQKIEFAKSVIQPIIGALNYKKCTDVAKLTQLRDKLNAA